MSLKLREEQKTKVTRLAKKRDVNEQELIRHLIDMAR